MRNNNRNATARVCGCASESAYMNQTCALSLIDLNLKTFYCRQNERERIRERESALNRYVYG